MEREKGDDVEVYNISMVFKRTIDWQQEKMTFTASMLQVLAKIDGKKCVAEVAEELNVLYEDLFTDLLKLHELKLISIAEKQKESIDTVTTKKRVHYRGNIIDLEKQAVSSNSSERQVKAEHYRGTPYSVSVG